MIDQQKIYEFALEWIGIFENPDTRESDIDVRLGEECADLEFVMDCGKSFEERYSFEAFADATAFSEIEESIDDAAFLGCAIFSKWRGITYWWNQNLLEPRNRVWFKFALMRLAELTEPKEIINCFRGVAEQIYLESNNICYGPRPEPDEEVEQHLELSTSGIGRLRRYAMGETDEKPVREMALLVGEERARKILGAVGEYFSDYEPSFTTDVGVWTLTITNTDGEEFHFDGSLCGSSPLSDFIRAELGMDDLFLFDGSPDRIEHLELFYQRRIRDASSSSQSEEGYWYYLEKLSIDRAEGSLEYTQGVGGKSSASHIYRDTDKVAELLDELDLLEPELPSDVPDDLIENENYMEEYKLSIEYRKSPMVELSGVYDKYGLPENWSDIIDEVLTFIRRRGFVGAILDSDIYEGGRRRTSDLTFVYVRFGYGDKEYCYLADEDIYDEGDLVLVPVGGDGQTKAVEVTRVEYHSAEDAPYPLDKIKKVIGKTEAVDE